MVTALDQPADRRQGPRGRRRRFPDQAGRRHRADGARAQPGAAEVGDRRVAQPRHRPRAISASAIRSAAAVAETGLNAEHAARRRPGELAMSGIAAALGQYHRVEVERDPQPGPLPGRRGLLRARHREPRPRRLSTACGCAASCARSTAPATPPSLMIAEADDKARVLRGLDIGVQRLPRASDRPQRARRPRAHPGAPQALRRPAARRRCRPRWSSPSPTR